MTIKMKGLTKGLKYISRLFVVKDREMEIGQPTDVKHVAHIGFDGPTGSAPTWMNEFKTPPDFATTSIRGSSAHSTRSSLESESNTKDIETPKHTKKHKRKKTKSTSSESSPSSSRSSRAARSKAKFVESTKGRRTGLEAA
ncbi:CRIB domain-containing protein RIC10-like [Cornus florida]|uniref:CRIB domain-containing protein RIC10-like n=1 Tax=Cornus florida TaxID=4283 RepID=UPI002898DFA9|nr:CRIB domain-containing protein RIC10-like [Cornus florida]